MKKRKKLTIVTLTMVTMLIFAACSSENEEDMETDSKSTDITKVNLTMPHYSNLTDGDKVTEAINDITIDKYGIEVDTTFIPSGNWEQQMNLLMTGSDVDVAAIFTTPLSVYINNGQLLGLSNMYENNATDEFKAIWTEDMLQGTSMHDELYSFTNFRNYANTFGLNINEDIAAEYGIEDGQTLTMEDVDDFLAYAKEKNPSSYPLAPQAGNYLIGRWSWDGMGDMKYIGVLENKGQSTEVKNLFETDEFIDFTNWARKWYEDGYIIPDIMSNTEGWQTLTKNGIAVSNFDNYGVNNVEGMIRTKIIDGWIATDAYPDISYGINANSNVPEEAFELLEILYTDPEVATLLNCGIENIHYITNEDGTISLPEGKTLDETGYPYINVSWLVPYSRISPPMDVNGPNFNEDLNEYNRSATKSNGVGFVFDTSEEEIVDAITACYNISDKYYPALMSGAVDPSIIIPKAIEEFKAADIDLIIEAKQRQFDEFLSGQ